ncbi:MAG: glycosyltransferase family 1 protein [Patescibacteria group bacterium]
MRIGVDIRCLSEARPGGVPRYTRQLLEHLLRLDQQNEYILYSNSWARPRAAFPQTNTQLRQTRWPNKLYNSSLALLRRPQLDRVIGPVDLFFVPNINFVSLSKNCPFVLTVHDLSFEIYPRFLNIKRRLWHAGVSPRRLARRADKIIAVSEQTKKDLIDVYEIPAERIEVIYSGIDEECFHESAAAEIKAVLAAHQLTQPYFLSIGFLEPRKNLVTLLQAFDQFKERSTLPHTLFIVGAAGWQYSQLQKMIAQLKHGRDIRLLGYLSDREKRCLLRAADLFIYPSVYEGFGFPPLESVAVGTPVIAAAAPALPEVLRDSAILVQPYNVRELTEALLASAGNDKLRQLLLSHRQEVLKNYTWQQTAKKTLDLFTNLVNNAHRN